MANNNAPVASGKVQVEKLKKMLDHDSVKKQFKNALAENAGAFVASVIDLYGSDTYLQNCEPRKVVMEALKAATLKLPINKQLGFAYIVPYKGEPQFQVGYKGYVQLGMRTGQYRHLNADIVPEGVEVKKDLLTGKVAFTGEPTSDEPQGYFAYMELMNGFSKTVYMTKEEVTSHAERYSASYKSANSAWKTNFDQMAIKTVLRKLLSTYGYLSTEMMNALTKDEESVVREEIAAEANQEPIDVEYYEESNGDEVDEEEADQEQPQKKSQKGQKAKGTQTGTEGPGF